MIIPSANYNFFHYIDISREDTAKARLMLIEEQVSASNSNNTVPHYTIYVKSHAGPFIFHIDTEELQFTELRICFNSRREADLFLEELQKFQSYDDGKLKMPSLVVFSSEILDVSESLKESVTPNKSLNLPIIIEDNVSQKDASLSHISPTPTCDAPMTKAVTVAKSRSSNMPEKHVTNSYHTVASSRMSNTDQNQSPGLNLQGGNNLSIFDIPVQDDDNTSSEKELCTKNELIFPRQDNKREIPKLQSPIRLGPKPNKTRSKALTVIKKVPRRLNTTKSKRPLNNEPQVTDVSLTAEMERIRKSFSGLRGRKSICQKAGDAVPHIEISSEAEVMSGSVTDYSDTFVVSLDKQKEDDSSSQLCTPTRRPPMREIKNFAGITPVRRQTNKTLPAKMMEDKSVQLSSPLNTVKRVYNELEQSARKRKANACASQDLRHAVYRKRSLRRPPRPSIINVNDDGSPIPINIPKRKNLVNSDDLRGGRAEVENHYNTSLEANLKQNGSKEPSISSILAQSPRDNEVEGQFAYEEEVHFSFSTLNTLC